MQPVAQKREQLERSTWSWVDSYSDSSDSSISTVNLKTSYRLHFPVHHYPDSRCKRNCRSNPRCYCGLGESQWLDTSESDSEDDAGSSDLLETDDELVLERRLPGIPAGLKNLGNTCYVNSFLQIWFHNVRFRQALYKWEPEQDSEECKNETILEAEHYRPVGKVATLQALFAMLEFTNRKAVDPNDFIAKLGLDPQVQQDAQEFSKLFISLLEANLSNQTNSTVRQMVQSQFRGEYAYVTTCLRCLKESKRPSFFYELDLTLQGHKTLLNCINDFLKEEKLEGENQYFCESCQSKQDATRCVRLSGLPPVLNLQLNRFIFDMATGRKKKLNSFVQFPEQLDMSSYLRQEAGTSLYSLTGVLMHVGAEANHGHYLAHIRDIGSGQWYKFSDSHVEELAKGGKKVGSESDPEKTTNGVASKAPKVSKGNQGSNNAYMLVYTAEEAMETIRTEWKSEEKKKKKNLPDNYPLYLQAYIEQDRRLFEEELKENLMLKQDKLNKKICIRLHMRGFYSKLPYYNCDEEEFEFVPTEWLHRYIINPQAAPVIETSRCLCVHGNLDLDRLNDVKAVSAETADELYQEAGDGMGRRLTLTSLCHICVRNRCRQIKLACGMQQDAKLVTEYLKNDESSSSFWVGKVSLKRWRTLARETLEDVIMQEADEYAEKMIQARNNGSTSPSTPKSAKLSIEDVQSKLSKVGTDVIISKGGISSNVVNNKKKKKSNKTGLTVIHNGAARSVESASEITAEFAQTLANGNGIQQNGHNEEEEEEEEVVVKRSDAVMGSRMLFNADITCPHGNLSMQNTRRRLVSQKVWDTLKQYFPQCRAFTRTTPVCNLCAANADEVKLLHEEKKEIAQTQKSFLNDILNERNRPSWAKASLNKVYLIPRSFVYEWRVFIRNPSSHEQVTCIGNESLLCEHEGLIYPLDLDTESDYESVVYMVSEEEWGHLSKMFQVDREISVTRNRCSEFLLTSSPEVCRDCVALRCRAEEEQQLVYKNVSVYVRRLMGGERPPDPDPSDPDFENGGCGGDAAFSNKRIKLNGNSLENNDCVRRSNRRQKVRGEREFCVNSDMLLRDFKVKIMEVFKVAPFDQNLCLNGVYLTDSSQTLGQLRVLPKSLIYLRADEPNPEAAAIEPDDGWVMQHPEEGFKGTGLLSGS